MFLNRPAVTPQTAPTQAAYFAARGAHKWPWLADVSYSSIVDAAFELFLPGNAAPLRLGWLRVVCAWLLLLLGALLAIIGLAGGVPGLLVILVIAIALTALLAVTSVFAKRRRVAQFMAAAAFLRELAARMATPLPAGRERDVILHHVKLRYVDCVLEHNARINNAAAQVLRKQLKDYAGNVIDFKSVVAHSTHAAAGCAATQVDCSGVGQIARQIRMIVVAIRALKELMQLQVIVNAAAADVGVAYGFSDATVSHSADAAHKSMEANRKTGRLVRRVRFWFGAGVVVIGVAAFVAIATKQAWLIAFMFVLWVLGTCLGAFVTLPRWVCIWSRVDGVLEPALQRIQAGTATDAITAASDVAAAALDHAQRMGIALDSHVLHIQWAAPVSEQLESPQALSAKEPAAEPAEQLSNVTTHAEDAGAGKVPPGQAAAV